MKVVIPVHPTLPSFQWTTGQHYIKAMPDAILWNILSEPPPKGDVYFLIEGLVDLSSPQLLGVYPKAVYYIDSHISMVTDRIWNKHKERYKRFEIFRHMCNESHLINHDRLSPEVSFVAQKQWVGEYPNSENVHLPCAVPSGFKAMDKTSDFIFIGHEGAYHPARIKVLNLVSKLCAKNKWLFYRFRDYEDPVGSLSSGKVVINISVCGDVNMRFFEANAVATQIMDYDSYLEAPEVDHCYPLRIPVNEYDLELLMKEALLRSKQFEPNIVTYEDRVRDIVLPALKKIVRNRFTANMENKMQTEIGPHDLLLKLPSDEVKQQVIDFLKSMPGAPFAKKVDIDALYKEARNTPSDINEHLETMRKLAFELDQDRDIRIVELGVRTGVSTAAWIKALADRRSKAFDTLMSIDIDKDSIDYVRNKFEGVDFFFPTLGNSLTTNHLLEFDDLSIDILFIDTLHEGSQLLCELTIWAPRVSDYIVLHDTETFGEVGENGGLGLKWAVEKFLDSTEGRDWQEEEVFHNNNGLTILRRG